MEIGQEVRVEWLDAKMWGSAWADKSDMEEVELPLCTSRGKVLKIDENMVLLLQSETNGDVGNLIGIPQGCIKKVEELE